jgi:hypothetical protein
MTEERDGGRVSPDGEPEGEGYTCTFAKCLRMIPNCFAGDGGWEAVLVNLQRVDGESGLC